jgi:hypothetical protein
MPSAIRFSDVTPCDCGYPANPKLKRRVEEEAAFEKPRRAGCLGSIALLLVFGVVYFVI